MVHLLPARSIGTYIMSLFLSTMMNPEQSRTCLSLCRMVLNASCIHFVPGSVRRRLHTFNLSPLLIQPNSHVPLTLSSTVTSNRKETICWNRSNLFVITLQHSDCMMDEIPTTRLDCGCSFGVCSRKRRLGVGSVYVVWCVVRQICTRVHRWQFNSNFEYSIGADNRD